MSNSTTNSPKEDLPPNVQITFRDDVTQTRLRQAAERSVATQVARFAEEAKRIAAAQDTRAKLQAAVNAPLMRLIEEDPAAAEALYELRNQPPLDPDPVSLPRDDRPITDIRDAMAPALEDARGARDLRVLAVPPPYDFDFSWVDPDGGQPFQPQLNKEDGRIGLESRSGHGLSPIPGVTLRPVQAYSGFGLIHRPARKVRATYYASRRMSRQWWVRSVGPDPDFVSIEAGTELTAFVDGTEIQSAEKSVMKMGAFNSEAREGYSDPFDVLEPRSLSLTMEPGHTYTVDVGIYVKSYIPVPSGSGTIASVLLRGEVSAMSLVTQNI